LAFVLWLCLHFPKLPLEALTVKPDFAETHLRVVIESQHVITCDDAVEALGVKAGLKQSTVRGLLSGHSLQLLSRDRGKEQQTLKRLRQWAYSITPTLSLWREDCLQLEVSRCLLVHSGLENLLRKLAIELDQRGFSVSLGMGPSREAAWLFSQSQRAPLAMSAAHSLPLETQLAPIPLSYVTEFPKDTTAYF
jgi:protein ImuB